MLRNFTLIMACVFLFSCSSQPTKSIVENPHGLYINKTLLDSLNGDKLLGEIPRFCEEILFAKNDTLEINNIVEQTRLHFSSIEKNDFVIDDPSITPFFFTLNEQQIALWDTSYLNTSFPSIFIKSDKSFVELLNEKIIVGKYIIIRDNLSDTIEFDNKGSIFHWDKWKNYELCLAGDCAAMSEIPANIINLINGENDDFFTWKIDKKTTPNKLVIYTLSEETPEIKGERKIMNDSIVLYKIN